MVNDSGGKQTEPGVAMLLVIPGEEILAKSAGVLDGAETVRKAGSVFHRFELAFRIEGRAGAFFWKALELR